MKHYIDLDKYHFKRAYGDVLVYGTWAGQEKEPALVLTHAKRRSTPCVIPLSRAWIWSEEVGDMRQAVNCALDFANVLGTINSSGLIAVQAIASAIRDNIGELLSMPPMPMDMKPVADAIVTLESGKQYSYEVKEDVH